MTSGASAMTGSMAISTAITPALADDDGVEVEGAEVSAVAQSRIVRGRPAGSPWPRCRRAVAAARAFQQWRRFDAMDHREGVVVGQRRHLGLRIIEDFDEDAAEAEADRGTEQWIVDDAGIGFRDALDHRLDQRAALETRVSCIRDDRLISVADLRSLAQSSRTQPSSLLCRRPGASALTATAVPKRRRQRRRRPRNSQGRRRPSARRWRPRACRAARKSHRGSRGRRLRTVPDFSGASAFAARAQ